MIRVIRLYSGAADLVGGERLRRAIQFATPDKIDDTLMRSSSVRWMRAESVTRRAWLTSLAAAGTVHRLRGQSRAAPVPARKLNLMALVVSDIARSVEFYQALFGMPIQGRQGSTVLLRVGAGPQFLALKPADPGVKPGYSHIGLGVANFDAERTLKILTEHGVMRSDERGPMRARIQLRGPEEGGAKEGTPELFFSDPNGISVQLQDATYCGGAGRLGDLCRALAGASPKGLLAVRDLSHFTIFAADPPRSQQFYQEVFGFFIQAHQGPNAPVFGVGPGHQFLMFAGGRNGATAGAINHGCFFVGGFNPDAVLKTLTGYGLKPRADAATPAGPLQHYVTLRMENRGGSPGGTPELYFTDPDGILLQLQDVSYCGGAGRLGEICTA